MGNKGNRKGRTRLEKRIKAYETTIGQRGVDVNAIRKPGSQKK